MTCFNHAFRAVGFPEQPAERIRKTVGMTLKEAVRCMAADMGEKNTDQFITHFKDQADRIMAQNTVLYPGTKDILAGLKDEGFRTGIVTSKLRYRILDILRREDMTHQVDVIVGFDNVRNAKPDPEGLFMAMKTLTVTPDHTLYVGDSEIDAQAAANAGIRFIGVLTGTTTASDFEKYCPMAVLQGIQDLRRWIL